MQIHFISGLPRSGSTLLAALLRQNPKLHHMGMSSPLAQIVMRVQHATSRGSEGAVLVDEQQRVRLLRGLFRSYYSFPSSAVPEAILDTNRAWTSKMPLLAQLFPDAKVIGMVREVGWIINSMEKLIQSNPTELSGIFGFQANTTVYSRVSMLAAPDGMVGYAMQALLEAYAGPFADRLMLVEYEALAHQPKEVLKHIYEFLGLQPFEHDLENFDYEATDFDSSLGTPGLHRVRGPVRWEDQRSVLPPDQFMRFQNDMFWRDQNNNTRQVRVIMHQERQDQGKLRIVGR